MRKSLLTSLVMLPLLISYSHAAQNLADAPDHPWIFSSEDSGNSSYLGVDIADVTTERLSALKLKEEKGVEVTMVDQDAPAGKAGIKEHDVILTLNGSTVESAAQLRRMIKETPPGRIVTFGISRDGQPITLKVQLADKHKEYSSWSGPDMKNFSVNVPPIHVMPDIDIPSINMVVVTQSARSGLMVENITQQLGEFFGVKNGNGVLVRSVDKGSRAEKAGFRAGDVIVKINDEAVHDTSDFTHAVKSRNGNSVPVSVVRDKKEQSLTLTLPERTKDSSLLEEESFEEEPLIQAESAFELSQLQNELAEVRPEVALVEKMATEDSRKAMDEVRKSLCTAAKEFRQQTEKQREEFRKQQREFRKQQEELRKQLNQLSHTRKNWADI
jgi:serine protease Do